MCNFSGHEHGTKKFSRLLFFYCERTQQSLKIWTIIAFRIKSLTAKIKILLSVPDGHWILLWWLGDFGSKSIQSISWRFFFNLATCLLDNEHLRMSRVWCTYNRPANDLQNCTQWAPSWPEMIFPGLYRKWSRIGDGRFAVKRGKCTDSGTWTWTVGWKFI